MEFLNLNWSVLSILGFIIANSFGLVKYMIVRIDRMDRRLTTEIEKAFSTYLRQDTLVELNQIIMNLADEMKEIKRDNITGYRTLNERLDKMVENYYKQNREN